MTEQDIQNAIQALYEATADTLSSSDDDYLTRRQLINRALHRWENTPGYFWDSLWAQKGDQTVVAGTSAYAAPANFRRPGGFVDLYDTNGNRAIRLRVVKPNDAQALDPKAQLAYFTGDPINGYFLNLSPVPASGDSYIGYTIKYNYYKKATEYTASTSVSEIPDPEYVIHSAVAELWKNDRNMASYQSSLAEAEERLKGMQIAQFSEIDWQDNSIPDAGDGFGY